MYTAHNQETHFTFLCGHRITNVTASIIGKLFLYIVYAKLQTYKCKVCTHSVKNIFITECKLHYFSPMLILQFLCKDQTNPDSFSHYVSFILEAFFKCSILYWILLFWKSFWRQHKALLDFTVEEQATNVKNLAFVKCFWFVFVKLSLKVFSLHKVWLPLLCFCIHLCSQSLLNVACLYHHSFW